MTGSVSKSGNLELGEEMVQYCYEPVQGDQVRRGVERKDFPKVFLGK